MPHALRSTLALTSTLLACTSQTPPGGDGDGSSGIATLSDSDSGTAGSGTTSDTGGSEAADATETADATGTEGTATATATTVTGTGDTTSSGATSATSEPGTDDGSSSTGDCPSAEVTFTPVVPTVVLLIDQSGSMTSNFAGQSRWNAVRSAIIGSGGVVETLQSDIRFGLALYTSNNGSAGGVCPILTEVAPAIDNFAAITSVYAPASPEDETPTGESVSAVAAQLAVASEPGPKIIVLATDGEPDTCAVPNPQEGQAVSVAAVEDAFAAGIRTFVISVGSDVSQGHLQDLANAGTGWSSGDPDAPYYVPADQAAMVAAFGDIVNGVRDCVLTLDGSIVPGQEDQGVVTVNGEVVPFGDPDGWHVNSPTEIELDGAACEAIQTGEVEVTVEFPCGAIVPS